MVEPNLTQVIRRQMDEVEANELRTELNERIRNLFGASGGSFNLQPFPAGAYEVDDTVGDGRPNLVLLHHDAFAINADPQGLPPLIEEIFKYKGTDQRLREFRNNLVFVVADERQVKNMKDRVRRRLALAKLKGTDRINQLAAHQQEKVKEEYQKVSLQGRRGDPALLPAPVLPLQRADGRLRRADHPRGHRSPQRQRHPGERSVARRSGPAESTTSF